MKQLSWIFVILFFLNCGERKKVVNPPPANQNIKDTIVEYIHISHTRSQVVGKISDIVSAVDYDQYQVLCLGGDIDAFTSLSESTIAIWDTLFHFGDTNTLWTLGHHDTDNRGLLKEYTGRPLFYTYHIHNVSFIVLDTDLNYSMIEDEQLELVKNVCDSISSSTALIILSHKLFWMPGNDELEPIINDIANGKFGNGRSSTQVNNFYDDIYPQLVDVKNRGVKVLCIAGDIGYYVKEFEYLTDEGIHLIASGIQITDEGNKALILENNLTDKVLTWRFELLENL